MQRMTKGESLRAIAEAEGVTYAMVCFDLKQMRKDFGVRSNEELMYRLGLRNGYARAMAEIGAGKFDVQPLNNSAESGTIQITASSGSEPN